MKIFFGAAPGVGKTYEMLQTARERKAANIDVVVGIAETHGRAETARLLDGLEIIPRRSVSYKGTSLEEMDLDAILARRPALVLVDELAHSNAPGSRHPKRYLDVLELLDAGIDVYTTLNVQHLESLNDIIAQITRIRVRETVPDSILDRADQIEVIDVTPETLTQRLHEGKVYVKQQAERALKHYFSPGNLTALRELALRRTAQRVDDQMLNYMRQHAIEGPWAAGDRILVCIGEDTRNEELVRYTYRVAERLRAPWTAIYVETDRQGAQAEAARNRVALALRLAERMGGTSLTLDGGRIADVVLNYAHSNNVTHIVTGKSSRSRWSEMIRGSIVQELVRKTGNISVHVIAGETTPDNRSDGAGQTGGKIAASRFSLSSYLSATLMTMLATGACLLLDRFLQVKNLSLVYLAAVLFSAIRLGPAPSVFSAILCAAVYNFLFLPPLYTFTIADPANVISLIFFLIVALITSNLAGQLQRQTKIASVRAKTTAKLYAFSRKLAGISLLDDLLWAVVYQIASLLESEVVILLPQQNGNLEVTAAYPPEDHLAEGDIAAAQWCWKNNHAAGRGTDTLPGGQWLFLPIQTGRQVLGIAGIRRTGFLASDERRLLDTLLDQAAVGVERIQLARDVDRAHLLAETEKLRNALLTSVSHDLRTPLAAIIGALTSLKSFGGSYDKAAREELLATSVDEAERLDRLIGNLLDMTKLESGGLVSKQEPVDLSDIAGTAVGRLAPLLARHKISIAIDQDLPSALGDALLLEQVLINLLDNAAKYANDGTRIRIAARRDGSNILLTVEDEGPGIPADALEMIFDKFTRLRSGDTRPAGTGLGLQICRGFVTAMGGMIQAANRLDVTGAVFTVSLPSAPPRSSRASEPTPLPDAEGAVAAQTTHAA